MIHTESVSTHDTCCDGATLVCPDAMASGSWQIQWVLLFACVLGLLCQSRAQQEDELQYFLVSHDLPEQRQALMTLLAAVGQKSDIAFTNSSLTGAAADYGVCSRVLFTPLVVSVTYMACFHMQQ